MQEQNDSKHDTQNISFDTIYSDENQKQINTYEENLINQDTEFTCCYRLCLWWLF